MVEHLTADQEVPSSNLGAPLCFLFMISLFFASAYRNIILVLSNNSWYFISFYPVIVVIYKSLCYMFEKLHSDLSISFLAAG